MIWTKVGLVASMHTFGVRVSHLNGHVPPARLFDEEYNLFRLRIVAKLLSQVSRKFGLKKTCSQENSVPTKLGPMKTRSRVHKKILKDFDYELILIPIPIPHPCYKVKV